MSALAPGFDPLIAEAKLRMRRRRVLTVLLVVLVGAGVLALLLRPSSPAGTGTTKGTRQDAGKSALAHLTIPVDAAERTWRAGIKSTVWGCACGLTSKGVAQLQDKVVAAAEETGAKVVRFRIWPPFGEVEVVLATRANPARYLVHRAPRLVHLLGHSYPYVKVVSGEGSSFFEWYRLPSGQGILEIPWQLHSCSPIGWYPELGAPPPPCPAR